MAYWLLKTEPEEYSFDDLMKDGKTEWDGVRNAAAQKHMRSMRPGDRCLIYHTGRQRAIVGEGEAASGPYPDPSDDRYVLVDVKGTRPLPRPVSLAEVKADERFADWELVRISRLSVMPVPPELWRLVMEMAGR